MAMSLFSIDPESLNTLFKKLNLSVLEEGVGRGLRVGGGGGSEAAKRAQVCSQVVNL